MSRVPVELREQVLGYWRGHSEAWKLSGLTQKEYCAQHNVSLKNFGNWRGQLKRVALMGAEARWGHYPRLRRTLADLSPRANPRAKPGVNPRVKTSVAAAVRSLGKRREFSEELKQRIVMEASRPGASASEIARRYGLDLRLLRRWQKAYASALPATQVAGDQP
jgi:hypothetical protein